MSMDETHDITQKEAPIMNKFMKIEKIQFGMPTEMFTFPKTGSSAGESTLKADDDTVRFTHDCLQFTIPRTSAAILVDCYTPELIVDLWSPIYRNLEAKFTAILFSNNYRRSSYDQDVPIDILSMQIRIGIDASPTQLTEIRSEIQSRMDRQHRIIFGAEPVLSETGKTIDLSINFVFADNNPMLSDKTSLRTASLWNIATEVVAMVTECLTVDKADENTICTENQSIFTMDDSLALYHHQSLKAARNYFAKSINTWISTAQKNEITVINGVPGIGKTHTLNNLESQEYPGRILVLTARHDIKENLTNIKTVPEKPNSLDKALRKVGCTINSPRARLLLPKDMRKTYDRYMEERREAIESRICCTTHADFLHNIANYSGFDTIIFDEDIKQSLVKHYTYSKEKLNMIINALSSSAHDLERRRLQSILTKIEGLSLSRNQIRKIQLSSGEPRDPQHFLKGLPEWIDPYELSSLLSAHDIYINGETIHFGIDLRSTEVLRNKKVLVLSATPSIDLLHKTGLKVNVVDIPKPTILATMEYRPDKNIARSNAKGADMAATLKYYKENNYEVITYKTGDSVIHFGADSGSNAFAGKDIAVIGTPFPSPAAHIIECHVFFGRPLVEEFAFQNAKEVIGDSQTLDTVRICDDVFINRSFNQTTLNSLIQAVGRCRPYEHNCRVVIGSKMDVRLIM